MRDEILLGAIGIVIVGAMTVACFITTGEDGTILAAAGTIIGTIIGLVLGRRSITGDGL